MTWRPIADELATALRRQGQCLCHSRALWGAMCPTDDVVAHLMLMRGDEHMFWKRCNQHPPHRPEAAL